MNKAINEIFGPEGTENGNEGIHSIGREPIKISPERTKKDKDGIYSIGKEKPQPSPGRAK